MALMPPGRIYTITCFADLQTAVALAPYNLEAARAVRDFLMQGQARYSMTGDRNEIALEVLKEAQRTAAERGSYFALEWNGVRYNPPAIPPAPPSPSAVPPAPAAPLAPAGVNFTSHQRVGDEIRDSYIEHVHDMFARGFIDADEHDARLKALMLAHTKEEMEFLIQDLPKLKELDQIKRELDRINHEPSGRGFPNLALAVGAGLSSVAVITNAPPSLGALLAFIVLLAVTAASAAIGLTMAIRHRK